MRLTRNSPIAFSNDYYTFRTIIIERFPVHPYTPGSLRTSPTPMASSKPPANHVALPQSAYTIPCRPPAPCGLAPRPTRTSRTVIVNATTDVGWSLVSQLCGPAHGVANSHALAFPKWRVGSGYGLPWVSLVLAVCFFSLLLFVSWSLYWYGFRGRRSTRGEEDISAEWVSGGSIPRPRVSFSFFRASQDTRRYIRYPFFMSCHVLYQCLYQDLLIPPYSLGNWKLRLNNIEMRRPRRRAC